MFKLRYWWPWSLIWQVERENEELRDQLKGLQESLNAARANQGPPFMMVAKNTDQKIADAIDDHVKDYMARRLEGVLLPHVMESLMDVWRNAPKESGRIPQAFVAMESFNMARVRFTLPEVSAEVSVMIDAA